MLTFLFLRRYIDKYEFGFVAVCLSIATCALFGWPPALAAALSAIFILLPLKKNRYVHFFSKISFSLYLTHDIVGSRLVVYLGTQFPKTTAYKGAFFLLGIGVSILFAWLFYKLAEQPFMNRSKSIKYQSVPQQSAN